MCKNLKQSLQKLSAGGFLQRVAVDLQEDLWRVSSWGFLNATLNRLMQLFDFDILNMFTTTMVVFFYRFSGSWLGRKRCLEYTKPLHSCLILLEGFM